MQAIRIFFTVLMLAINLAAAKGQYTPTHISNTGIYEFLDELASAKVIDINTAIKPYSRQFISEQLLKAADSASSLSKRQKKELEFYLLDYSKEQNLEYSSPVSWAWIHKPKNRRLDFFYYTDTAFKITVNPILGANTWNNSNGFFYHWWNGVETQASYGNFALFASLRDNHESIQLTDRDFMNQRLGGGNFKYLQGGKIDYEEMRAGMTYAWKWGHAGLVFDQFAWGDAYNGSNIFSGRTPAFARIDLQLNPVEWLQFSYVHGWLISEVVDSARSFLLSNAYGSEYREVYHSKFLAANMFSLKPFDHFYIGVGNSIVYDLSSPHFAFFIPVMFWKAIDHTLSAGIDNMNSQLFFTLSSRNFKNLHIYGSAFIDEIQVGRIFREGEYNFSSFKAGASYHMFSALNLRLEYTWTNVLTFMHYVPTTTFESNAYNLGHYLEDNAKDLYASIELLPFRTMKIRAYYNLSRKGPDHTLLGTIPRASTAPFIPLVWEQTRIGVLASMQVINDLYLNIGYEYRDVSGETEWIDLWTPDVYKGQTSTFRFGMNYGF